MPPPDKDKEQTVVEHYARMLTKIKGAMDKLPLTFGAFEKEQWSSWIQNAPRAAEEAPEQPWVALEPQNAEGRLQEEQLAVREAERSRAVGMRLGLPPSLAPTAHAGGHQGIRRVHAGSQRQQILAEEAGQYTKVVAKSICLAIEAKEVDGNLLAFLVEVRECEPLETSDLEWAKLRVWWLGPSQAAVMQSLSAKTAIESGKWRQMDEDGDWIYRWQIKVVGLVLHKHAD